MNKSSWQTRLATAECISAARARGRKPGREAQRRGLHAQAVAAAAEVEFYTSAEDIVQVYAEIGHSCMSRRPDDAAAYAHCSGGDYAVAVYRSSARAIVRLDRELRGPCYGPDAGLLALALDALGYPDARAVGEPLHQGVDFLWRIRLAGLATDIYVSPTDPRWQYRICNQGSWYALHQQPYLDYDYAA